MGVHSLYQTEANYVALVPQNHSLAASKDRLDLREVAGREEFITFGNVYPLEMQGMDEDLAAQFQNKARYSVANAGRNGACTCGWCAGVGGSIFSPHVG